VALITGPIAVLDGGPDAVRLHIRSTSAANGLRVARTRFGAVIRKWRSIVVSVQGSGTGAVPGRDAGAASGPPVGPPAGRVRVAARAPGWGRAVRRTRWALQVSVVAAVMWQVVGHVTRGTASAEAWCPFGGFETLWTVVTTGRTVPHTHTSSLVLAVAITVLALIGRGFFCGWLCPFGSLQEWIHRAARSVTDRVPALRRLRRRATRSMAWRRVDRVLRWGRWLVLAWALIGAAVTGTMVIRQADPWAALLSVVEFELSLAFAVLLVTFLLALVVERPFCRYACPLGAVQGLLGKVSPIAIQRDAATCAGCDLCNRACPVAIPVNALTRVADSACIGCLECVAACPSRPALNVTFALPIPPRS
jgi:ferredoxin